MFVSLSSLNPLIWRSARKISEMKVQRIVVKSTFMSLISSLNSRKFTVNKSNLFLYQWNSLHFFLFYFFARFELFPTFEFLLSPADTIQLTLRNFSFDRVVITLEFSLYDTSMDRNFFFESRIFRFFRTRELCRLSWATIKLQLNFVANVLQCFEASSLAVLVHNIDRTSAFLGDPVHLWMNFEFKLYENAWVLLRVVMFCVA